MLTVQNTDAIRRIEDAIGYTFNDKRLLVQVLTRKTYLKLDPEAPDNEVLEFYGDTLMNYHVTNYFMSKYAHMLDDGLFFMRTVEQFTDMRSHYVCNRYLTERVKAMGLARYLRAYHRDSELRRDGEKVYADIFESLVGAIYLDSYQNDALIRAFILRQLGIEPKATPTDIEDFDYDTLHIRPTVAEEMPATVEEMEGEAVLPAEEIPVDLPAPAEEIPAELPAVAVEAAEEAPAHPNQDALAAFCLAAGYELPTYGEAPKNTPNARTVAACTLKYRDAKGKLVKISLNDSGKSLFEATEKAAAKMLRKLEAQAAEASAAAPADAPAPTEKQPDEAVMTEEVPVVAPAAEATAEVKVEEASVEAPTEGKVEGTPVEASAEPAPAKKTRTKRSKKPVQSAAPDGAEESPKSEDAITVEEKPAEVPAAVMAEEPSAEIPAEVTAEPAEVVVPEQSAEPAKPEKPKRRRTPAKKVAPTEEPAEVIPVVPAETLAKEPAPKKPRRTRVKKAVEELPA